MSTELYEIDWSARRPTPDEVERSWRDLSFAAAGSCGPSARSLVQAFRDSYSHGDALCAKFKIVNMNPVGSWFLSRNRLHEYDFPSRFISSAGVSAALPQLGETVPYDISLTRSMAPLMLDGDIARQLHNGGAHSRYDGRAADAKKLAQDFVAELTDDHYENFSVHTTSETWSRWFGSPVWSRTWIVTDKVAHEATLLAVTDMD